ncbi:hypothetical protein [Bifidobacterium pseudocatenulatum]|uniref:hypothetical protein n=1 Tax=Bifidobacterium pseudocatenulatum TaxID=28026 RepID=UPI001D02A668|nr:hypothetical protein [Bifidobacterium pseudocatenulatum]UDG85804.1 hypothetical protein KYE72_05715 [Bifidobacterium pseudocatenulatum]
MAAATAETAQTPVVVSRMYGTYADMGVSHMSTIMPASQRTTNMVITMGTTMGGSGLRLRRMRGLSQCLRPRGLG